MTVKNVSHSVRAGLVTAITLAAVMGLGVSGAVAEATTSAGTWGAAQEIPGTAALNAGGSGGLSSVSCPSAGNCGAGGGYTDGLGHAQAFVVDETGGTWGTAQEVPGTAALNVGGSDEIDSVSCPSAGDCSAGGQYLDGSGHSQAFVVSEAGGTWGAAQEVPGTAALNIGGFAVIDSVSCPSARACGAGGYYVDGSGHSQAFVVNQTNGTWGTAQEVPGTAALDSGGLAQLDSLSCASAGNCSAGGKYTRHVGHSQAFVVSERNGTWRTAREVPGSGTLNVGRFAGVGSVSCASAGNCAAAGFYRDGSGHSQAFVVNQTNGTWGTAQEVPGTAALNAGGLAVPGSVSCASAGNCSAGGGYTDGSGHNQAFVVNETNGTWGTAEEVPGTATLNVGGFADITVVSCAPAGNCSAGGSYTDSSGHNQAFVVNQSSTSRARSEHDTDADR
ncbi:MAG TPA: hypothetical protein VGS19_05155 [Streptosporangiaceae bacterium]|nr:hypothetical protein [Streptosporangiaceae bacterium]